MNRQRKVGLNWFLSRYKSKERMSTKRTIILILLLVAVGVVIQWAIARGSHGNAGELKLVWSDEFDSGTLPDATKWGYDVGDGCPNICGWGNNELQYYTADRGSNARIENGHLMIEAHPHPMGSKEETSARLTRRRSPSTSIGPWPRTAIRPRWRRST